jgi:hypothetical protein
MPSNPLCPVKSFVKYFSVLHPDCDYFWQRPKPIEKKLLISGLIRTASMEAKISFLQFPQDLPASVTVEQHEIYKYFVL